MALHPDDQFLEIFQTLSNSYNPTIGVGLPFKSEVKILISLVFFYPNTQQKVYFKQHLHIDELSYFVPGEGQVNLHLKGLNLFPAICYESFLPEHAESAAKNGADLYLASVANPEEGIDKAFIHYPKICFLFEFGDLFFEIFNKITNNKSQKTNKFQMTKRQIRK